MLFEHLIVIRSFAIYFTRHLYVPTHLHRILSFDCFTGHCALIRGSQRSADVKATRCEGSHAEGRSLRGLCTARALHRKSLAPQEPCTARTLAEGGNAWGEGATWFPHRRVASKVDFGPQRRRVPCSRPSERSLCLSRWCSYSAPVPNRRQHRPPLPLQSKKPRPRLLPPPRRPPNLGPRSRWKTLRMLRSTGVRRLKALPAAALPSTSLLSPTPISTHCALMCRCSRS